MSNVLNLILRILQTVIMILTLLISLATAYIVFAPDDWPKPFYLVYAYPEDFVEGAATTGEANTTTSGHNPASAETSKTATTPKPAAAGTKTSSTGAGSGIMVNMGTQIINLNEASGKRYIRVTTVIEVAPPAKYYTLTGEAKTEYTNEFNTEIEGKKAIINDVIISLISTKNYQQLYTTEGKESLRTEILKKVSERVPHEEFLAVYFTEFVID